MSASKINPKKPQRPLVLNTSLQVIGEATRPTRASRIMLELEQQYYEFFGDFQWKVEDMHAVDRQAWVELREIICAFSENRQLNADILQSFRTSEWRIAI